MQMQSYMPGEFPGRGKGHMEKHGHQQMEGIGRVTGEVWNMTDEQITYAVAYARVSTDDKGQDPESQLVAIRKFAKDRNIEIMEEFRDEQTGTNANRFGLQAMYGYCNMNRKVRKVLVLDADRLSRNMDDSQAIVKMYNDIGVQITYVADENLDLTTKEGKLINAFKSYGAQTYTDDHKIKVKAGLERARQNGKTLGRPLKRANDINPQTILYMIEHGYSLRQLEKVFNCSRMTLIRRIKESGNFEKYEELVKNRQKAGIEPKPEF